MLKKFVFKKIRSAAQKAALKKAVLASAKARTKRIAIGSLKGVGKRIARRPLSSSILAVAGTGIAIGETSQRLAARKKNASVNIAKTATAYRTTKATVKGTLKTLGYTIGQGARLVAGKQRIGAYAYYKPGFKWSNPVKRKFLGVSNLPRSENLLALQVGTYSARQATNIAKEYAKGTDLTTACLLTILWSSTLVLVISSLSSILILLLYLPSLGVIIKSYILFINILNHIQQR